MSGWSQGSDPGSQRDGKVLVSAASRHGATAEEIGRALREALHERGDDVVVEVRPAEEVNSVDNYDAVVLGSAVYAGHWLEPARELAVLQRAGGSPTQAHRRGLGERWRDRRGHRGARSSGVLGQAGVRATEGDFRDWEAIREWAKEIAAEVHSGSTATER
jgi:menaquinone-dependent protoporphyrinogen oxidase